MEIISAICGLVGAFAGIFGVWYSIRKINEEKAHTEFERGQTCEKIYTMRNDICRAFTEISQVREETRITSNSVIEIKAGIDYLILGVNELKSKMDKKNE